MFGIPAGRLLVAGAILGLISFGLLPDPAPDAAVATINIEAIDQKVKVGETVTVPLYLQATAPVNAFKGTLTFNPDKLLVKSIGYNVSIADLWAEEPWYSNGDGTLTFIGGTTKPGGFVGREQLLVVTFEGQEAGETALAMQDLRILRHDGIGTDAPIAEPIDTIFTVTPEELAPHTVTETPAEDGPELYVLDEATDTDLNGDGKQSIADTSIFMAHLATQNLRSDFNQDGKVTLKDLSILNKE